MARTVATYTRSESLKLFRDLAQALEIVNIDLERADRVPKPFTAKLERLIERLNLVKPDTYFPLLTKKVAFVFDVVLPTLVGLLWLVCYHRDLQTEGHSPLQWELTITVLNAFQHFLEIYPEAPLAASLCDLEPPFPVDNKSLQTMLHKAAAIPALCSILVYLQLEVHPRQTQLLGLETYVETFSKLLQTVDNMDTTFIDTLLEVPKQPLQPKQYIPFVNANRIPTRSALDYLLQCLLETNWNAAKAMVSSSGAVRRLLHLPRVSSYYLPCQSPQETTVLKDSLLTVYKDKVRELALQYHILDTLDDWWQVNTQAFSRKKSVFSSGVDNYLKYSECLFASIWALCEDDQHMTNLVMQRSQLVDHMAEAVTRSLGIGAPVPLYNSTDKVNQAYELLIDVGNRVKEQGLGQPVESPPPVSGPKQQDWLQQRICYYALAFSEQLTRFDQAGKFCDGDGLGQLYKFDPAAEHAKHELAAKMAKFGEGDDEISVAGLFLDADRG